MSREIEYRAWHKRYKEMYEVNCIDWEAEFVWVKYYDDDREEWFSREEHFADLELMQYTGLKDKNGVEIYEGDIIRDVDNRTHTVIYERGMFGCYKTWLVSYETGERQKSIESLNNFLVDEAIVIGNIYENPELLEDTK